VPPCIPEHYYSLLTLHMCVISLVVEFKFALPHRLPVVLKCRRSVRVVVTDIINSGVAFRSTTVLVYRAVRSSLCRWCSHVFIVLIFISSAWQKIRRCYVGPCTDAS
jgi:hypothetical protein